jgi:hypothetical protein
MKQRKILFTAISVLCILFIHDLRAQNTSGTKGWYSFTPDNNYNQKSLIGLDSWNDEPAGEHGCIKMVGDKLMYNGEEIKLWGLNNCYESCMPSRESADKHAAFYRRYGINAVRLHKYADNPGGRGIQSDKSFVDFDPETLDRMDYYVAALKKNGIFTKLSPTFGIKLGPADTNRVPWHDEIGNLQKKNRIRATYGAVYFSRELQNMQIEQTTKLLEHVNPYTGKKYAEDPAIFCVEMFNEDAILWYGSVWTMQRYVTLRERTARRFSKFLMEKYGSEAEWREAWGEEAIYKQGMDVEESLLKPVINMEEVEGKPLPDESIKEGTVVPWHSIWVTDNLVMPGNEKFEELRQRMFDTGEFLIGLQNDFYSRFAEAMRETGYDGVIMSSNWQAGDTYGHYLNLHSDQKVGIVDRHNYFGGAGTSAFEEQKEFIDGSLLATPGKATMSAGLQQVNSRPFMLSEWIHVIPNEYGAEGPALLGSYGWGLNGWDVSFMFENGDDGAFSDKIRSRYQRWDVANPAVMVNFASVARQVRRMDVTESPETQYLNVHVPSLLDGKVDFYSDTEQKHDVKTFTTSKVPPEALAAKRVAVRFTDEYKETPDFNIKPYLEGNTIVSNTEELRWTPAKGDKTKGGYFTVNTKATKAFAGFSRGGETYDLGDGYNITPGEGFCVIYLTAKGEKENLDTADEIVVTVMARARNTGMVLNEVENKVLDPGRSPVVLEPVKAEIEIPFNGELLVLGHDGIVAKSTRNISEKFEIDGSKDKTPFYLIRK